MQIPDDYTLERFVEDYLPDYEERFEKSFNSILPIDKRNEFGEDYVEMEKYAWGQTFAFNHFPEALRAFGGKLCKEQREICAVHAKALIVSDKHGRDIPIVGDATILFAPSAIDIEQ